MKTRAEWLELLQCCQNGDATCLFVLNEIEQEQNELANKDTQRIDKLEKNEKLQVSFDEGDPEVGLFSTWVIDECNRDSNGKMTFKHIAHGGSLRNTIDQLP